MRTISRPQPSGAGSTSQPVVMTAADRRAWEPSTTVGRGWLCTQSLMRSFRWLVPGPTGFHLTLLHGWCFEGMGHGDTGRGNFCRAWCRTRVGSPCGIGFRLELIESLFL